MISPILYGYILPSEFSQDYNNILLTNHRSDWKPTIVWLELSENKKKRISWLRKTIRMCKWHGLRSPLPCLVWLRPPCDRSNFFGYSEGNATITPFTEYKLGSNFFVLRDRKSSSPIESILPSKVIAKFFKLAFLRQFLGFKCPREHWGSAHWEHNSCPREHKFWNLNVLAFQP